jgi:hypothetical protein
MNKPLKSGARRQLWRFYRRINGRILLVCLLISGFIWLLRNLSKEFESRIPIQVTLSTLPSDCIWMQSKPLSMEVEVETFGFSLLGSGFLQDDKVLELDFATYPCKNGYVNIPTSQIRGQVIRLIGREQAILGFYPDTLRFEFNSAKTKMLPIKISYTSKLSDGSFLEDEPRSFPSEIVVSGPESMLDTMQFVYSESMAISGQFKDTLTAKLLKHPLLTMPFESAKVVYSMDDLSEKNFRVAVKKPDLKGFQGLRLFPDSVTLTCFAGSRLLEQTNAADFVVEVAPEDLKLIGEAEKLNLAVTRIPEGISEVKLRPGRIEYLILKRR